VWKGLLSLCSALVLTLCGSVSAATFDVVLAQYHGPEMGILVRGPIIAGDGKRFRKSLDAAIGNRAGAQ
jgi:hypothetical protein